MNNTKKKVIKKVSPTKKGQAVIKAAPKKLTVKKIRKSKTPIDKKSYDAVKVYIPKLQRSDLDKINAHTQKTGNDIRLSKSSSSGCKLLRLHYDGKLRGHKGKTVVVLSLTDGLLHTLNHSDRQLLTLLGYLSGSDKADVIKFYADGKKESRRKALSVKFIK